MPTMAASVAPTRPLRTWSSSVRYSASASKSLVDVGMVVKVLLQNDGGGLVVDNLSALRRDHGRRVALVDQLDGQVETAMKLVGEAARAQRHLVFGAVRMARLADHEARRAPLVDQLADELEAGRVVDGLDGGQGLRLPREGVPHCDADALDAEVEPENDVNHYHAWPASEASISGSMPSSLMAAI